MINNIMEYNNTELSYVNTAPTKMRTPSIPYNYMPSRPTEQIEQTVDTYVRTPSIPYNYMPRPQTTPVITNRNQSTDYVGYDDSKNSFFDYNQNYEKKFNDKLFEKRVINFNHKADSSDFVPFEDRSSLI